MELQEKQLLIKALCSYISHQVYVDLQYLFEHEEKPVTIKNVELGFNHLSEFTADSSILIGIKPYLRPLITMTPEEAEELKAIYEKGLNNRDWLEEHKFDYRDLIGKNMATPATPDMYKLNKR